MQSTTTNAVFLECYLAHNVGDDLFLETLLRRYPDTHFTCVADGSYDWLLERYHNISLVRPPRKKSALRGKLSLLSSIAYTNELAALKCQSVRNSAFLRSSVALYIYNRSGNIRCSLRCFLCVTFCNANVYIHRLIKLLFLERILDRIVTPGTRSCIATFFNKYVTDICFRDQYTFQLFKSDEHIGSLRIFCSERNFHVWNVRKRSCSLLLISAIR